MFGKKEKAEKPAKPAKAASKPKKSKGSSSGKSGPNFFAAHIEKLVMGLVVAAAGYLVYAGISGKGYPTDREPGSLSQDSSQVLQQISEDHWPALATERDVKHAFVPEVEKSRRATEADQYAIGSLREASSGPRELRGDPKILPPEQLVVKCVSGAIAIEVPNETPDPFEAFEDADRIIEGRRPPRNRNTSAEEEDDEDKIKPPPRRLFSKYDLGAQIGAMLGMGGEGGMGMGGMGMGGMGGMGMGGMGSFQAKPAWEMPVEVYGVVYLYNPVSIKRLGLDKVTENTEVADTVQTPAVEEPLPGSVPTQAEGGAAADPANPNANAVPGTGPVPPSNDPGANAAANPGNNPAGSAPNGANAGGANAGGNLPPANPQ